MILDLRDNPGGLVFEAIGVASQFIPEGETIYLYEEKNEEPRPGPNSARRSRDGHTYGRADQRGIGLGCGDHCRSAQRQ